MTLFQQLMHIAIVIQSNEYLIPKKVQNLINVLEKEEKTISRML